MSSEILKIRDLVVSYGENIIINNLNLDVIEGEFVGIIGPNGTGKSTFIKAITNIIEKKEGYIRINGKENNKISKRHLAQMIAVVPQEFSIEYDFSNYDIVMMGRNPHIDRKKKFGQKDYEIIKEAMKMTNTWHFRDNLFNELSGGERQRVIVARAIAQQAKIILLDEPTSHLDIHHQLEIMELIQRLKENKKITVVAVLHDINMATRFSDRLVLLNDGKIVADGTPDKVVTKQNLSKLYNMEMIVRENKVLGTREIVPIRVIKEKASKKDIRVHVICGGGSGEEILEKLNSLGVKVKVGIVNRGDSDWEICKSLDIPCVEAPPFSGFNEENARKNLELMRQADCILVTNLPFGNGNLKNLEVLLKIDKPIFMYKNSREIDYTDGVATRILDTLEQREKFKYIKSYKEFISDIIHGE